MLGAVEIPRTLLVTNDFPPRVGGIQRTLEALWAQLPPERVAVFCPDCDDAAEYDAARPYPILTSAPSVSSGRLPTVADREAAAVASTGAEVVLFGAGYPFAGPGPAARRPRHRRIWWRPMGSSTGSPCARCTHSLMRYATSKAARVPVMCSEFIARTVRTAVPAQRAGLGAVPGRRHRGVPARSRDDRPARPDTRSATGPWSSA